MSVMPRDDQIEALAQSTEDGPIVMVNLLRFRDTALYAPELAEAGEQLSGRDAYRRYGATALACVLETGGTITWGGRQELVMIGGPDDVWDEVMCVRYPSRTAFLEMTARPDYRAALYHRDAGLARTVLLCCSAGTAA
ncbi:MAG TPA: DUF1330 domain-containing protein [Rhizomicrobium sp.]|nr:DUF1330 domain-containing protein [Rhizomicrobium sp.]